MLDVKLQMTVGLKVIFHANISLQQNIVPEPQVWLLVLIFINTPPN